MRPAVSPPLRIMCNSFWFERHELAKSGEVLPLSLPLGGARTLRSFKEARRVDGVVFNNDVRNLLVFCFLKKLFGMGRSRIISVDMLVPPPNKLRRRLLARLAGWLFPEVDLFLWYGKDTTALRKAYRVPADRIQYIAFKVNDWTRLLGTSPRDEGFVLVGGRSYRDYDVLSRAVAGLPYRVVVLEYSGKDRKIHTGRVQLKAPPANLEIVPHDGAQDTWVDWFARARLVVLPIRSDTLFPASVSTYLQAMALGKCTIVTRCPASIGLIENGEAILVPPDDPVALRAAIQRAYEDDELRRRVGEKGKAYALSLREEERLTEDIVRLVTRFIRERQGENTSRSAALFEQARSP
jgi:glycosyltransferase involved in cell wall biosynthesis